MWVMYMTYLYIFIKKVSSLGGISIVVLPNQAERLNNFSKIYPLNTDTRR